MASIRVEASARSPCARAEPGRAGAVRAGLVLAIVAAALLAAALVRPGPAAGAFPVRSATGPEVSVIATGLRVPWDIAFLPDGRALVTERGGGLRIVGADLRLAAEPLASISVSAAGEGGLLGIAVDPAFAAGHPFVYVYATVGGELEIQRWRMTGDRLARDGVVLDGIEAGQIHDSGRIRFGPDGALYVLTGDAGNGDLSQDPASRNGKVLRIAPGAYRTGSPAPERVALGLRNPQGLAWQPGTGRLFVTDHGPSGFDGGSGDDELNAIVPGGNYGWPEVQGRDHRSFIAPAQLWEETIAPSGLAFVTRPNSAWSGDALVAALKGRQLRRLSFDGARVVADEPLLVAQYGRLRAVVEAPDGSIWVTTSNRDGRGTPVPEDDRILRIVPPACPVAAAAPAPRAARRSGAGRIRLTPRQFLINQRIAQAALLRLRAIEARAEGLPEPARSRSGAPRRVRVSARQLLITQRIAQAALRLHASIEARLEGRTPPPAAAGRRPVRVKLSVRQLRINQRIAQAAVRRANALAARTC